MLITLALAVLIKYLLMIIRIPESLLSTRESLATAKFNDASSCTLSFQVCYHCNSSQLTRVKRQLEYYIL